MRHKRAGFKLKRNMSHRRALLRNLVTSVIESEGERIITTVPKAKAAKPLLDKMITLGKQDTLHARRLAARFLLKPSAVKKLFDKIAPRFAQRNGGYSQIIRVGWRKGDGAELAILQLTGAQLIKRAEERARRREERLKAMREGREEEESGS
ncbi:MAG: 50S ribosomal protein L17 [Bryobacteraceae bacterium]